MDGSSSGVGMKNTDQRLRGTFGPGAGLRIHSNSWGYSVSFFIPMAEEIQESFTEAKSKAV
jgi:sensor histidine kinase YesM